MFLYWSQDCPPESLPHAPQVSLTPRQADRAAVIEAFVCRECGVSIEQAVAVVSAGRTIGENDRLALVANRADPAGFDTPLNKEDLAKRRRALAMVSVHSIRDMYREAY